MGAARKIWKNRTTAAADLKTLPTQPQIYRATAQV